MYADSFPPLTFADLSKAIQRESWGLGQTCPDGTLDCLPVDTSGTSNTTTASIFAQESAAAESPYYVTIGGAQVSMSAVILGGLAALIAIGIAIGGRR